MSTAFDDSKPPDWERLQELDQEAQKLVDEGKWNRAEFERLMKAGEKAANGHPEFLESIALHADPSWL